MKKKINDGNGSNGNGMFFDGMRIIRKYARFRKNFNIKKR